MLRLRRTLITLIAVGVAAFAALGVVAYALEPKAAGVAVAPDPALFPEPVVQVYGANVWGLRGRFAIHTWIATKARNASTYTIYEVIGWRLRRHGTALSVSEGNPARQWFGSDPILLHEVRGAAASTLVERVRQAVQRYPFEREYTMWPGPNSNSFIEWVSLEVPELGLSLPTKAIGQVWMRQNYASAKAQNETS